ncbi:post-GPI attachment to proteins factor 6-like isoform X3 [Tachypleus tridentatus]|uniref:post-GPI attachment to proteins factor 6-like isoform X3 n=1 Tax=Tachypleus tridentatus TaxID=6853 RepID=UPI003FD3DCAC
MATGCNRATVVHFLLTCFFISGSTDTTLSEDTVNQVFEARELFYYRSYTNVQILHYTIPVQTLVAVWEFKANGSSHCTPKPVSVLFIVRYLQYGSYPVINPQNETFPPQFHIHRQNLHHVTLQTDSEPVHLNISGPLAGDWFAVAFVAEKSNRIVQKGLYLQCKAWLTSSLRLQTTEEVLSLSPNQPLSQQVSTLQYYRFYTPRDIWSATVTISSCAVLPIASDVHCPLVLVVKPLALPSVEQELNLQEQSVVNCYQTVSGEVCSTVVTPIDENWNYILVTVQNATVEFSIHVEFTVCQDDSNKFVLTSEEGFDIETKETTETPQLSSSLSLQRVVKPVTPIPVFSLRNTSCWRNVPLVRHTMAEIFAFRYEPLSLVNSSFTSSSLHISTEETTLFKFNIYPIQDIGGTLEIKIVLPSTINITRNNITLAACVEYARRPRLSANGNCGSEIHNNVNTSSEDHRVLTMLIPYPEPGPWYLALTPRCYFQENDGNENEVVDVRCHSNKAYITMNIRSSSCIQDGCGDHGKCHRYFSGGFIFSTCVCSLGWRGWGCTDDAHAIPDFQLLLGVLLLTLSNIFFIPAIVLSVYRHYYTEALIYFVTMFFSTFYHACDAEMYSFCIMRLSVLQFCDFYSAILAFWVTLIVMANLPVTLQSLTHMAGAVGITLGVEYDRTGLWVFLVPSGVGLIILTISWVTRCRYQRACYPRKRTWLLCLLPGVIIAVVGLVIFAFLQTDENYKYVHSGWHAAMALSVLFLLPERQEPKDSHEEGLHMSWKQHGSFKFLQDSETDML